MFISNKNAIIPIIKPIYMYVNIKFKINLTYITVLSKVSLSCQRQEFVLYILLQLGHF